MFFYYAKIRMLPFLVIVTVVVVVIVVSTAARVAFVTLVDSAA